MPLYIGDKKVKSLHLGRKEVLRLQVGSDIVFDNITFPTTKRLPSSYTLSTVARVDGANHTIYTAPASGFYEVTVQAGHGKNAVAIVDRVEQNLGACFGAYQKRIVFLYGGTKCLLWGGESYKNTVGDYAKTGYPEPSDNFGGSGGYMAGGSNYGGGGGGAANNARQINDETLATIGGAGAGFIAGLPFEVESQTWTPSGYDFSVDINTPLTVGDFSVSSITSYVLCGGGGGCSDPEHRLGMSGGGGAYGDGGPAFIVLHGEDPTPGPGGNWGWGDEHGIGGASIIDFSWNQFMVTTQRYLENPDSIGSDGYVELKRVIEN